MKFYSCIDSKEEVRWCLSWQNKYWWCATAVDANGKFTKWGTCQENCPKGPPTTPTTITTTSIQQISTLMSTTTGPTFSTTTEPEGAAPFEQFYYLKYKNTTKTLEIIGGKIVISEKTKKED